MPRLYIQYQNNSPVPIYPQNLPIPQGEEPAVADLVAAVKQALPSKLGAIDLDELTLHLPSGFDRSASGLGEDCFAASDSTALDSGCLLSALGSFGSKSKEPLVIKSKNDMEVDSFPPSIPSVPFDPAQFGNRRLFPFFDYSIEKYLKYFGESALLGRDNVIKQVNTAISRRFVEKYQPIICSTSRGMGKTALMEAIGMQLVKPNLKNKLLGDALAYGRILSFDFACAAAETAIPTQDDIRTFFTRLMIYFLCRLFSEAQVDGIVFEEAEFSNILTSVGKQTRFNEWKTDCLKLGADRMMDEYIRLTNLAFGVTCFSPPVFLLDEIQVLCEPTSVKSKLQNDHVVYHTYLSLLLAQLASTHKPVCICTGTNSGKIISITEKSNVIPSFVHLSIFNDEDCMVFWNQRTVYMNLESSNSIPSIRGQDNDMVNSLVYASYQIPRLLLLAHRAWFNHTISPLTDAIAPLQRYEEDAITYYSEMSEFLYNTYFEADDIPYILMCCGVRWEVRDINAYVPGTKIEWTQLISMSLIFPYLDNCYIIPFSLLWAARTPSSRSAGDHTKTRAAIQEKCKLLIPNFDISNLFVSYDQLRQLDLYNLGMCYEKLFASSMAVQYHLRALNTGSSSLLPFSELYRDASTQEALSGISVDFSLGIMCAEKEMFVNSVELPKNAVTHNCETRSAHHDIILPAVQNGGAFNIAVSCKASFSLKFDKRQLKVSKKDGAHVDLLIWLYLGNEKKEEKYSENVVFMNGYGCCNGLALDMFILIKKLTSLNNRRD